MFRCNYFTELPPPAGIQHKASLQVLERQKEGLGQKSQTLMKNRFWACSTISVVMASGMNKMAGKVDLKCSGHRAGVQNPKMKL